MNCPHLAIVTLPAGESQVCTHALQHRHWPGLAEREVDADVCAGCTIRELPSASPQGIPTPEMVQSQRTAWAARPLPQIAPAEVADFESCVHRTTVPIRYEDRRLCGQSGKEPVYACAVHGECTLGRCRAGRKLACCLGCTDYEKVTNDAQAGSLDIRHWSFDISQVTFGITAFERPQHLERLVASILRFYPSARIVVADNGRQKATLPASVDVHHLEFDCGLSAARQALVERLTTPYFLLLEEDFVFTEETKIERFAEILAQDDELGSIGGSLRLGGVLHDYAIDLEVFRGQLHGLPAHRPVRCTPSGLVYRPCDKHYNFGLWRREVLLTSDHAWDGLPKLGEHSGYFWRVKQAGRWRCAQTRSVVADHDLSARSGEYRAHRARAGALQRSWLAAQGIPGGYHQAEPLGTERLAAEPDKPNVVVFGVGHSGTSVLAKMLFQAGWHAGDADEEYGESISIRALNEAAILSGALDNDRAGEALRKLTEPWAIKDPRFVRTLSQWFSHFAAQQRPPLLVWIRRDSQSVARSYINRGEQPASAALALVEARLAQCRRLFDEWPWEKLAVDYEQIDPAVRLFGRVVSAL